MNNYVTVSHNGQFLHIYPEIAEKFNLKPYQNLSETKFWEVLKENALHGIALCQLEIAIKEFNRGEDLSQASEIYENYNQVFRRNADGNEC